MWLNIKNNLKWYTQSCTSVGKVFYLFKKKYILDINFGTLKAMYQVKKEWMNYSQNKINEKSQMF